jgi:hypothetical protein
MAELRRTNDQIAASFSHAAALLAGAFFISLLAEVPIIDQEADRRIGIPIEIGITKREQHGHRRLLRIIVETMAKRKWLEGAQEIAGLFQKITMHGAVSIIKAGEILARWTGNFASAANDVELVICHIADGTIFLRLAADPNTAVGLDLTKQDRIQM